MVKHAIKCKPITAEFSKPSPYGTMQTHKLNIETFLAVAEMVAAQLRIKEADRWSPQICQLKYVSFVSEFPMVTGQQLMWAAEQWIQSTTKDFLRYPTWDELMTPLFRCEGGRVNKSWGFREDLPQYLRPQRWQLDLLPALQSVLSPPDLGNRDAYALAGAAAVAAAQGLLLEAAPEPPRLAPAVESLPGWDDLVQRAENYDPAESTGAAENP